MEVTCTHQFQLCFSQKLQNYLGNILLSKPTGDDYNSVHWTQMDGQKLDITSCMEHNTGRLLYSNDY